MIISKNDDREVLPTDVIGRSVAHSKRWLVAIVRIYHEKKQVNASLKWALKISFLFNKEVHKWSDRRKVVDRVVLPMMIFVHVDPQEQKEVLTLSAISRYMVLRGESTPAVIPDQQMLRFKFMLDYSDETICMSTSPLAPGEKNKGHKRAISRAGRRIGRYKWEIKSCSPTDNVRMCMCRYTGRMCGAGLALSIELKIQITQ